MPNIKKITVSKKKKKNYDINCVKSILSPFHRFSTPSTRKIVKKLPRKETHAMGLTQKEKSYLIYSCHTKSVRYSNLKVLAATAIKENKIFAIHGNCNVVRKALLERGWLEKIPPNRMTLTKIRNGKFSDKNDIKIELEKILISTFLQKYHPNLIWQTRDLNRPNVVIDMSNKCNTIINKLEKDAIWTSKRGLCSSMTRSYWYHMENVAEVNVPRSYDIADTDEMKSFDEDYKLTACTSLLKWVISMVANEKLIFATDGKVTINVIVFALNRCKDYLLIKQNKDIDCDIPPVSEGKWNSFLTKYFGVISKYELFQSDKDNKLPLYLSYAKFLLKQIYKYRPQLCCEGCHNIWIIKHANYSRGRGILLASRLGVIKDLLTKGNSKKIIQKYIEEPLLIHYTKFDIRQYYLVTSTYPLIIWMYKDCYLKFSSQKYSLRNYHESIHLTNNAIQKKYENYKGRHSELPSSNMWDSDKYKMYLKKIGKEQVWETIIYPGMRKSIISVMLSCQDTLSISKQRFELYGCDFLLDKDYKPWLIEINSSPDLSHTTQVTGKICPAVVADIIKVVIDCANNPAASTGKFECIYRQPMTLPRYGNAKELHVQGFALSNDYFCRSETDANEICPGIIGDNECDIKTILDKLKNFYSRNDMVSPASSLNKRDDNLYMLNSDYGESVYALKISPMNQLNKLLHIDTTTNSSRLTVRSSELDDTSLILNKSSINRLQNVISITDIKTLLKKSTNPDDLSQIIKKNLSKTSLTNMNMWSINKLSPNFPKQLSIQHDIEKAKNKENVKTTFCDNVLQATSEIISFITTKEKEYLNYLLTLGKKN